jgi:Mg-chelatase subunit ChlD
MHRTRAIFWIVLCTSLPLWAQGDASAPYKVELTGVTLLDRDSAGKQGIFIHAHFTVQMLRADADADTLYKLVIEENGQRVHEHEMPRPKPTEDLSVVLAVDTSGSMKEHGRMQQARRAAETFVRGLPRRADCGLILFDHETREPPIPPTAAREPILDSIRAIEPRGGTAYLDAALQGIDMLRKVPASKSKCLVLVTDGVDLNSSATKERVIREALDANVRIYTIGIGEPGKLDQVNSVLVLDHSASMIPPADEGDALSKIEALRRAASRFVGIMPATSQATVLPFSSTAAVPGNFTSRRSDLIERIEELRPDGETALMDATYAAVATLDASGRKGKRAVVAMTDGIDNSSRRRVEEVIERAREAKIPLYMLGFGRDSEIDAKMMSRMAAETGGRYYHAKNEKALLEIFENLSIQLHDDGIDEATLREISSRTRGQYHPAKDASRLQLVFEQVTQSLRNEEHSVLFPSRIQRRDGVQRVIELKLFKHGGVQVSNAAGSSIGSEIEVTAPASAPMKSALAVSGLVVAESNPFVFLMLLAGLLTLLALPSWLRLFAAGAARG